ncbi:hypothetical protein B1A99_31560 [Cohnella sp. CIP 111063]|nr:hypothetical protein B1A99_31560 [Cohnella sp. CIP 111063]
MAPFLDIPSGQESGGSCPVLAPFLAIPSSQEHGRSWRVKVSIIYLSYFSSAGKYVMILEDCRVFAIRGEK